jgi:hypothetical protein
VKKYSTGLDVKIGPLSITVELLTLLSFKQRSPTFTNTGSQYIKLRHYYSNGSKCESHMYKLFTCHASAGLEHLETFADTVT